MISISFQGYFQYRQATDPDPTDEPRGISGYGFALAGEPDFDGVLRFRSDDPAIVRRPYGPQTHGPHDPRPEVGVYVTAASRNGEALPELVGGAVDLRDADLVERNGIVIRDDLFPLDPVRVMVWDNRGQLVVERHDELDPQKPGTSILDATSAQIERRQLRYWQQNSPEVAVATGLRDPSNDGLILNRNNRRENLRLLLTEVRDQGGELSGEDTNLVSALETRIEQLGRTTQWWNLASRTDGGPGPIDRRAFTLALQAHGWSIDVNGQNARNKLGGDPTQNWPLQFWMGGWDVDVMYGYIKGTLYLPTP